MIRRDDRGVFVLEIAARPIGGLCARALAFDGPGGARAGLEALLLRHALGERMEPWRREAAASGVMMIPIPSGGVFRGVQGIDDALAIPGVRAVEITAKTDQQLVPLPEGSSYLGFIFAGGETPEAAERALRAAHARLSFTVQQVSDPMARWMLKNGTKEAYVVVADYASGTDALTAFKKAFEDGGGKVVGELRTPMNNPDFSAYVQRIKDAKPQSVFFFFPSGVMPPAFLKVWKERGMEEAGIKPSDIDAIVCSHAHVDHIGGICTADGKPNFPNARIYISQIDHDYLLDDARLGTPAKAFGEHARANLRPVRDRIVFFKDGQEFLPGVQALAAPGHTPGHHIFQVASAGKSFAFLGDLTHHAVLLTERPRLEFAYDVDPKQALARLPLRVEPAALDAHRRYRHVARLHQRERLLHRAAALLHPREVLVAQLDGVPAGRAGHIQRPIERQRPQGAGVQCQLPGHRPSVPASP